MLSTKLPRTLSFGHLNFSSGALHHHRKADCCCIVASFIMSPVSRGFAGFLRQQSFRLPSSLRAAVFGGREQFFQPNTIRNSRNFGSSFLRRYEYQYKSQLAQKPSVFVNNDPVLRQVAQTRQPVTIYRAPKNRWYYLKVYGTAALWIGTGAYSIKFQDDVKDLKDLAFFIRPTYVVVGIGFIIIGSYICTAPVNRMRALEVLPSIHGGPMQLRMTVRSAPWTKERVVFANLGGPTISEKTNPMVEELMEAERARKQSVFQGLEHESIITRSWEYSARWVHQKWTNFFLSFKFAVLRFGIAKVEVQGEKWKIDCSGWLLEDGKAIDRLIPEE